MKIIKVFVSSPGDVKYERTLASTVFQQLNEEFGGLIKIEAFFWEDNPLELHTNPQAQTPLTSEFDIVVCLFWTRLGSLLDPNMFRRPDGNSYRSGTEFELETALASRAATGKPAIYLFRRTDHTQVDIGHPESETIHQGFREMAEYYAGLLGRDYLQHSSNEYEKPWEFVEKLYASMRKYVLEELETTPSGKTSRRAGQRYRNPFKGLKSFNYDDAPFFYGRLPATLEVIETLKTRAKEQCAFVMIFGSSGLGKSSLVRAGVLPWLRKPDVVENVRFWRHVALIPSQDKEGNLFRLLANALLHNPLSAASPAGEPAGPGEPLPDMSAVEAPATQAVKPPEARALPELGDDYDAHGVSLGAAALETLLCHDSKQASACIKKALQQIGENLGRTELANKPLVGRLVIFIDQFEELFSRRKRDVALPGASEPGEPEQNEMFSNPQCEQFLRTLEVLARSGWVWVIAAARSDFFAECEKWVTLRDLKQGTGTYHLAPPTPDELGEMIRRPAAAVDLTFEHNDIVGRWLDNILINETYGNPHALPLLEFTLTQLFDKTPAEQEVIRLETYDALKGVRGALAVHAEKCFAEVFPPLPLAQPPQDGTPPGEDKRSPEEKYGVEAVRCFESVARQMVMISTTKDEPPLRRFPLKENLESNPKQAELTDRLIKGRLLVVIADLDGRNVSVIVAHEALLSCWPMLAEWIDEHKQDLIIRDHVSADALTWQEGGRNPGMLYTDALRLENARRVLEKEFLDIETDKDFVRASIAETARRQFAEALRSVANAWEDDRANLVDAAGREKVLGDALEDSSPAVRCNAVEFMGRVRVPALSGKLVDLTISDPENRVRRMAAESLVRLGDENLFDELFRRFSEAGIDIKRSFPIVGGIARVQIAAEASEQAEDLSSRITALTWTPRARIRLRIRAVRFLRALPAFVLIFIPQLFLAAISAGFAKMLLGIGSYAVAQGDRSAGMGLFHGIVAAFFWGSFITLGIALHRFVYSRRRDRVAPASTVPWQAYVRPAGSLVFGAVAGFIGSYLIVLLIATVFSSPALYTMGWETQEYAKSSSDFTRQLWGELNFVTGYRWPYLFTGSFLGVGMAMMANRLQASAQWWQESHAEDQQLVDWRQVMRLFRKTTLRALAYAWPIPLTLAIGWVFAFSTMRICFPQPSPVYTWHEKIGWGFRKDADALQKRAEEFATILHKPINDADVRHRAVDAVFKDQLREWKLSPWGQGLGIFGDEIAQGCGGFFCIVGMGLGLIALARGINIEPSQD